MKIVYSILLVLCAAAFVPPLAKVKDRRRLIRTSDVSNGYLYLSGEKLKCGYA